MSLDFEWSFIRGTKKFSWYMVGMVMSISQIIGVQTDLIDSVLCRSMGSPGRNDLVVSRYRINALPFGILTTP